MMMRCKYLLLSLIVSAVTFSTLQAQSAESNLSSETETLLNYQDEVTVEFLKPRLAAFSADSMKGRETGTQALKKAAKYLASQYSRLGLQPAGNNNSYFQPFKLNATVSDSVVFQTYTYQDGNKLLADRSVASKKSTGRYIRAYGGTKPLAGKIVFAGFGIDDADRNVTHLEGAAVKDRWVLVFQDIPHVVNGDTLVDPSIDAQNRFQSIMRKGAKGILLIPDLNSKEFKASALQSQRSFGVRQNMRLAYRDTATSSSEGFSRGYNIINPHFASQLLEVDSLAQYRKQLVNNITDFEAKELSYSLSQTPYSSEVSLQTKNVLAYIEGSDPKLKEEVVVLTSHYDHLGVGRPDSTGDRIYNGADDDGSGTIGLLNIAKAFVEAGKDGAHPKRSILFLHVSAEEKGLLGSRFYSDHPVFPMEKTVANLNTDMIGRVDAEHQKQGIEEYAYIIGGDIISSDLDTLITVANQLSGQIELDKKYNDLNDPNQFYRRSDHWHFGRKRVPFAFFFSGIHEDYHRPSDEVHKIRFDKMTEILRTMYATTVLLANTDHPPEVDNEEFIEITKSDN